jgi:hypothetical protein
LTIANQLRSLPFSRYFTIFPSILFIVRYHLIVDDWFAIRISLIINTPPLCHIICILALATIIHAGFSILASPKRSRSPAEENGHTAKLKRIGEYSRSFHPVLPLLIINASILLVLLLSFSDTFKHLHPPYTSDDADRRSDAWLVEVHSKIWDRQDLSSELYHKVEVTVAHYDALQERLRKLHPDRDSSNYIAGANDVLSIKLEILQAYQPIPASASSPSVQGAHSGNEQILGKNDEDLEEESDGNDTELSSFLPATLDFLDLSSLGLQNEPRRLPLPLLLRQEYSLISQLIEERPTSSSGCVIVSGQPGTGEVLVFLVT